MAASLSFVTDCHPPGIANSRDTTRIARVLTKRGSFLKRLELCRATCVLTCLREPSGLPVKLTQEKT